MGGWDVLVLGGHNHSMQPSPSSEGPFSPTGVAAAAPLPALSPLLPTGSNAPPTAATPPPFLRPLFIPLPSPPPHVQGCTWGSSLLYLPSAAPKQWETRGIGQGGHQYEQGNASILPPLPLKTSPTHHRAPQAHCSPSSPQVGLSSLISTMTFSFCNSGRGKRK